MTDDQTQAAPSAPEPALPETIHDIAARALDVANQRAADREAGKPVPDALPTLTIPVNRDSQGKFAPQPKPSAPAEPAKADGAEAASAAADAPSTDAAAAAPAATSAPALQPHPRWDEATKATFARLPREAQQSVLDMAGRQDADYTRKTQELADQRKQVEPLVAAYGEHADFLNRRADEIRQPPARILGDMVQLYRQGTTGQPHERAQALGFVAQLFGIDLRSLAGGQPQGQQPTPGQQVHVDPAIARELQQLRQQQAAFGQFQQATLREREQQSYSDAERQIEAFRSAKDEQGRPKYPHFDAVRGQMAPYVEAGESFEAAYRLAAKPITDAVLASEKAAADAKAVGEAQARQDREAAERERLAQVGRARAAGGPRPAASRPGMTQSRDVDANAWEAMKKAGLVA